MGGDAAPTVFLFLEQIGDPVLALIRVTLRPPFNRHTCVDESHAPVNPDFGFIMLIGFNDGCGRSFVEVEHLLSGHDAAIRVGVEVIVRIEMFKDRHITLETGFGKSI